MTMKNLLLIVTIIACLQACSQQPNLGGAIENKASASTTGSILRSLRPLAGHSNSPNSQSKSSSPGLKSTSETKTSDNTLVAPACEEVNDINKDDLPSLDSLNTVSGQTDTGNSENSKVDNLSQQIQTNVESTLIASSKSNGLVPPPPAVTLSAPPPAMPGGYPPAYPPSYYPGYPPPNPYYYNPYSQMPPANYQANPNSDNHPHGSPFGNVNKGSSVQDNSSNASPKNRRTFNPINPTGMEARSAFKQRDDVSILWKGFINTPAIQKYLNDDKKAASIISQIAISLPSQSTRGSFTVSPSLVNQYFKGQTISDKKLAPYVKNWENNVITAYYHYLYTYNKFALAEQTVQARNQEYDVAETDADKQRAATDLAQAKADLNSAREDMKASQIELTQVAGVNAAKTVIAKISGITPQLDSYGASENSDNVVSTDKKTNKNVFGSVFGRHKKTKGETEDNGDNSKNNAIAASTGAKQTSQLDSSKVVSPDSDITFKLKNVNVTPRKSVLSVSIRNNGNTSLNITSDDIYVAEGSQKLPDAVIRTDLSKNVVSPNSETIATITIFGRPWNDMLNVVLVKDGKNINLIR